MKMNLRKTIYLVTLSALALMIVAGLLLVPGAASTSGTVSAEQAAAAQEARGEIATPDMIAYALTHKPGADFRYNVINQLPCQELSGDLSGKTVAPGVYCLASASLASELVLDGRNDKASTFIFRVAGALNAKGGSVSLANEAQSANVFFVAESAILSDGTDFRGNVLTRKSISVEEGSILRGKTESVSGEVIAAENAIIGGGTGTLEICKALDASTVDISDRIFQFTVSGVAGVIEVPVGSCSSPIDVPVGTQTITELGSGRTLSGGSFTGNFVLNRVETLSQGSTSTVGVINLSARTVAVNVVEGGTAQQLTLRFVNQFAITGFVEICKAAATGLGTGTGAPAGFNPATTVPPGDQDVTGFFQFQVLGNFTTNTQNPEVRIPQIYTAPVGQCTGPITVTISNPSPTTATPRESNTAVSKLPRAGAFLESVDTIPVNRLLSFLPGTCLAPNSIVPPGGTLAPAVACPGGGTAVVRVIEGGAANETVVNFRNRSNPGQFKVCKIAGPGIPENTLFRFRVRGFGQTNDAANPQTATFGVVDRIVDVRAGFSTPTSPSGTCAFVPGFGSGAGNAEFQTFVNGTPVFVFEEGLTPGQSSAFIPSGGTIRVARIRTTSSFVQPSPFAPRPNPDLEPGTQNLADPTLTFPFLGRTAVTQRAGFTEVDFTNFIFNPTLLKVCKIGAGTVATDGTRSFTFDVALVPAMGADGSQLQPSFTVPVTVQAGPASNGGFCTFVNGAGLQGGSFNQGSTVTITERAPAAGTTVTAITSSTSAPTPALPQPTGGLNVDLANRQATLLGRNGLVAGTTIVTFTNSTATGDPQGAVAFDFDGDRKSDVSIYRGGTWWYAASSANGQQRATTFGLATDKTVPADFDGDGTTDNAVFRPSTGVWYMLGSSAGFSAIQFGAAEDIPQAGDFDGDGKADVAVFRPSNGVWYMMGSRDGFTAVQFGANGDIPVAADYDGDRKMDPAVYRNGTWFMLRSRDGFAAPAFGTATDIPVPADYDGDGKADTAVYRNGTWFQMRSTEGLRSVQLGIATDQPVPADYDGDKRADAAVYRGGVWYMIRSGQSGEADSVQFGVSSDMPVPASFLRR